MCVTQTMDRSDEWPTHRQPNASLLSAKLNFGWLSLAGCPDASWILRLCTWIWHFSAIRCPWTRVISKCVLLPIDTVERHSRTSALQTSSPGLFFSSSVWLLDIVTPAYSPAIGQSQARVHVTGVRQHSRTCRHHQRIHWTVRSQVTPYSPQHHNVIFVKDKAMFIVVAELSWLTFTIKVASIGTVNLISAVDYAYFSVLACTTHFYTNKLANLVQQLLTKGYIPLNQLVTNLLRNFLSLIKVRQQIRNLLRTCWEHVWSKSVTNIDNRSAVAWQK